MKQIVAHLPVKNAPSTNTPFPTALSSSRSEFPVTSLPVPQPASQLGSHPRRWLRRLYLASRLPRAIDALVDSAPPHLHHFLATRLLEHRVRNGYRLVPERALEESYRKALLLLADRLGHSILGDYLEFGVAHGGSMACMARASRDVGMADIRLVGFDSFDGLPASADYEDGGLWAQGQFRTEQRFTDWFLRDQGVDMERVELVAGWFDDTLNEATRRRLALHKAGIIMIDCDLHSSARAALEFSAPLIRDHTVIVFDDWHAGGLAARNLGEKRAFNEFLEGHPEFIAEQMSTGPFGRYSVNAEIFLVSRLGIDPD